ncbi:hypothetical protein [Microcella sp.]|uniref:hypothetical protein n=1 Tax=Microcella sp. TaxID=1913979 RepID=UPI0025634CBE|nr:hypothetical protein [Microcella sp.]MBX9470503.1 hypothetical protein [Microcella sp.]
MRDPLSMADERQLAEWAFGRARDAADRERAEAALRELARRAEPDRAEGHDASPEPDSAPRHRVLRLVVAVAGVMTLAAIGVISLVLSTSSPDDSLSIFARDPSPLELDMSELVRQGGLGDDAEARILTDGEFGTVIAVRYSALSSHSSGTVCVAIVEFAAVSDASCKPVHQFTLSGLTATLDGVTGLISVDWGPQGDAQIRGPGDFDVGPSGG